MSAREYTVADWAARMEWRARQVAVQRVRQESLTADLRLRHATAVMSSRGYLRASREQQRQTRAELFSAKLGRWL